MSWDYLMNLRGPLYNNRVFQWGRLSYIAPTAIPTWLKLHRPISTETQSLLQRLVTQPSVLLVL